MSTWSKLSMGMTKEQRKLAEASFEIARRQAGRWLSPDECIERIAKRYLADRTGALKGNHPPSTSALARDRGRCAVPGCSRRARVVHQLADRNDEAPSLIRLCRAHLESIRNGYVRVTRTTPDKLRWELGCRAGYEPIQVWPPEPKRPGEA